MPITCPTLVAKMIMSGFGYTIDAAMTANPTSATQHENRIRRSTDSFCSRRTAR